MLIAKTVYNYNYYNRTAAQREAFEIITRQTCKKKRVSCHVPRATADGPNFHRRRRRLSGKSKSKTTKIVGMSFADCKIQIYNDIYYVTLLLCTKCEFGILAPLEARVVYSDWQLAHSFS